MFRGVYVQYLWHFTKCNTNAADKKKKSRLQSPKLYSEIWTFSISTSASGTWLRSDRRLNKVPLGNRRPVAPKYCCCHEWTHLTPKADGWVTASGECWLMLPMLQLCGVRRRAPPLAPPPHQRRFVYKGTSTVFHVNLIKPPWLDQKSNLKKKKISVQASSMNQGAIAACLASAGRRRPFPAVASVPVEGVRNELDVAFAPVQTAEVGCVSKTPNV